MIFTEPRFLLFFGCVFFVFWSLRSWTGKKLWLLIASYVFYAAWDWRFLSLILISTLVDYVVGRQLSKDEAPRTRRFWLLSSIGANLVMLGFFKYFGFFVDSAEQLWSLMGLGFSRPTMQIVLPVGISFFTFQTMSYSIDVYRRRLDATKNLLDLSLFVAFFPQLVAGPIVRAASFLPQLAASRPISAITFRPLLALFLIGFIKKACISDNVAPIVDAYFAVPSDYTAAAAWLAILLYAIQIYCDFSGYSDMAIACAGMLGFDLGSNFDAPYLATNLRDFWRRWHISLSTWLRDYLYVPLGGNRGGRIFTARNILLTMALGGLWHGAAWRFVIWGLLHGFGLVVHRQIEGRVPAAAGALRTGAATLLTFYWTCFAWIFFRAPDVPRAIQASRSYVFFESPGTIDFHPAWWLLVIVVAVSHFLVRQLSRRLPLWHETLPSWIFNVGLGVSVAIALLFVRFEARPFIYFQF